VPIAELLLQGVLIAWPSRSTGRRQKVKDPIVERNKEEDVRKTAPGKKPWMTGVQHLLVHMLICK
jgi:hypothetical protein